MGYVGNNGTYDVTYFTSRHQRQTPGEPGPGSFADFDLAHDHINSYEQGSSGGVYTVQSGDTLQGIAAALWGDASLWYKIAEVNGLTASSTLIEGQPLLIPVGVQRNENNAATYQPYDPLEVLGNTSPTSPKPKKNACGTFGQAVLVVVAAVVTIVVGFYLGVPAAIESGKIWAAVIAGAAAGAAGSIASQGVGVATGIQEKFSWNAVALAAIGGGVGAGVGAAAVAFESALLSNAFVQGVTGSAITQGIGKATGLQEKFSWAGVAAAGVGALAAAQIGGGDGFGAKFARSGARAIANAATRSLIEGSDFGDNLIAALPDVIGQTLGESIAGSLAGAGDPVEAQGDGDSNADMVAAGWRMDSDGQRYRVGLPSDVHGYAAAAPGRPNTWDRFWGGVGDFVGDLFGFDNGRFSLGNIGLNARRSAAVAEVGEEIVVTGRRFSREVHGFFVAWDAQGRADLTPLPHHPGANLGIQTRQWFQEHRPLVRAGGAAQGVLGTLGAAGSVTLMAAGGATAEFGFGIPLAAFGAVSLSTNLDFAHAGFRTTMTGEVQSTNLHRGLRSLGLSESQASTGEAIVGITSGGGLLALSREGVEQVAVRGLQGEAARRWIGGRAAAELVELRAGPYGSLSDELAGTGLQAHHVNQNAVFGSIIPRDEGFAVGMRGNAFSEVGSPHYEFHASLEEFWAAYRRGGASYPAVPTNTQYGVAVEEALLRAGYSRATAIDLAEQAAAQRGAYGLQPEVPVPRVPARLPQARRD